MVVTRRPSTRDTQADALCWRITSAPDDLDEGLFGQIVLWIFELLPTLQRLGVTPQWDIRSRLYGQAPEFQVIPGVFEPISESPTGAKHQDVSLLALRLRHVSVLGNDWQALHELWHAYFRVAPHILARADALALPANTLGVHYRGTDKNVSSQETNPVAIDDMLCLVAEHLDTHPGLDHLFVATDEYAFVEAARQRFADLAIHNLGAVPFHKSPDHAADQAERALLDCVLLSRCSHLLKCSSALSGFAKILNPQLAVHRVSASKVFFGGIPYFPDAHIPRLVGRSERSRAILQRQFDGDWMDDAQIAPRFHDHFVSLPRYSASQVAVNTLKYAVSVALGRPRKA